tara:strand:+ start:10739 stop:12103 length:1365 start_codon:yes stop_codon:yes gene_type:complete
MKNHHPLLNRNLLKQFLIVFLVGFTFFSCDNKKSAKKTSVSKEIAFKALLDTVQSNTFKYFWDFAEPISGMARERSHKDAFEGKSRNIITIGGSGLGISSFPTAVTRGWISREDAVNRLLKITKFLENCEKFHGAFAHWYYADSKKVHAFSDLDNGGDIVETALLIQGIIINKQFFTANNPLEISLREKLDAIWKSVEWDWYTQNKKSITWHWSTNFGFEKDLPVSGWNEALIVYVLAASSPTHTIEKETYTNGWTRNGEMKNGKSFYNHQLFLGEDYGGPLFLSQYSFMGIDPRSLKDEFCANYFEQNRNHSLINYEYCIDNPKNFKGYSENCWGLTASDNFEGYSAHSPSNDISIITPTAALSSFPYTPAESKKALNHFYFDLKDKIWGDYGFYDAFSIEKDWYSKGYLAIDQGPIVGMIENYRTQQLWNLFMSDSDIKKGLIKLGFTSPNI